MAITATHTFKELSDEEGFALLDAQTQKHLGITAGEFVERWGRGEYADSDDPHVRHLAVLIPLGRPDSARSNSGVRRAAAAGDLVCQSRGPAGRRRLPARRSSACARAR
jgi:hypothetical protein